MDNSFWKCATIARQNWHLIDVAIWPLQLALHLFRKLSGLSLRESDRCLFCAVSMAHSLSTSWGRKGRKGCTGQVLLAAVAAVAGSILSAPRSFGSFDHLWRDLIDSPQNWEDFRVDKPGGNPKFPDFKRTGDKESLWLNSAPDWVHSKLPEIETKLAPGRRGKAGSTSSKEHLWQELFDSPQDWEDFRVDKPGGNPKFPDFKRTGDKESLWLNSAPDWVQSKLPEIETKLAPGRRGKARSTSSKEHLWQDLFDSPQNWEDFRVDKPGGNPKFPDFKRTGDKESLWLDSAPDWVQSKLPEIETKLAPGRRGKARSTSSKEHLWQDLFDSPQDWEDFRVDKPGGNPKFPDFKQRTGDKESLWLNSAPDWVQSKLPEIETKLAPGRRGKAGSTSSKEHLWQDLFDSPQDWEDFRVDKPGGNPKFPDFKQRTGDKESLWLNSAPDWVQSKLPEIETKLAPGRRGKARSTSSKEHLWQDLFDSPQDWEDFRVDKPRGNPKFPDFKQRMGDKESLWLNSAPDSWLQYQEEKSQRNYVQDSTRSFWASVGFFSRTLLGFALKLLYSSHRTLRDSPGRIGLSHKLALE